MLYGAIEAGGTKFVCAVSDKDLNIKDRISIPTTTPTETLELVFAFFEKYELASLGVGSFGPIDVNPKSATYGFVTTTPKLAWTHFDFLGTLEAHFKIPVAWTTDVNAAAYGELKKGIAQGKDSCLYLTVGTGIGGGVVINGDIVHGFGHPETGHILVRRHPADNYEGTCPFHGDCLEGLAAGPSLEKRYGVAGHELPADHQAWEIEAYYLAQAIMSYTLILSPEIIVFGGGVMKQAQLFPMMRQSFTEQMKGYVATPPLEEYIVPCGLGNDAGITGCLILAIEKIN